MKKNEDCIALVFLFESMILTYSLVGSNSIEGLFDKGWQKNMLGLPLVLATLHGLCTYNIEQESLVTNILSTLCRGKVVSHPTSCP